MWGGGVALFRWVYKVLFLKFHRVLSSSACYSPVVISASLAISYAVSVSVSVYFLLLGVIKCVSLLLLSV